MSWRIEVKPSAEKQYLRLDRPTRKRIKEVLFELQGSEQLIVHPRVKGLGGKLKGNLRVRIGGWRLLMTPDREKRVLYPYAILPRGDAF